jgi:hypothetical protein
VAIGFSIRLISYLRAQKRRISLVKVAKGTPLGSHVSPYGHCRDSHKQKDSDHLPSGSCTLPQLLDLRHACFVRTTCGKLGSTLHGRAHYREADEQ